VYPSGLSVSGIVIGMKNVAEVNDNLNAVEESNNVPVEIWSDAVNDGLLDRKILNLF